MPCRRIQFHIIKKEYPQHTVVPIPSDYVVEADHIRCISDGGGRGGEENVIAESFPHQSSVANNVTQRVLCLT